MTLFGFFSCFQEAARIFGLGKDTAFHKACTDDYIELLKDQEVRREVKCPLFFFGRYCTRYANVRGSCLCRY